MLRQRFTLNSPVVRYTLAILIVVAALGLRALLNPIYGDDHPFETAWVAVVIAAWYLGPGPSVVTTLLLVVGICFWFLAPRNSFVIAASSDQMALVGFLAFSALIIVITEVARRARLSLRQAREELEHRVDARTADLSRANESLRELSGRLLQLQDEERRRIARELHDSVGQLLTAANLSLRDVHLSLGPDSKARAALADASELVRTASGEVRTISHLLHPPLFDEIGLKSALQGYVGEFGKRSNIGISLDLPGEIERMSPELETALFRIVQEALTNVHRHSGSSTALVQLYFNDGDICLVVQDSGRGIPEEKRGEVSSGGSVGVGLRGIRERLGQLGGTLDVTSGDTGTKITATIPLSEHAKSASAS